ncbi:Hypothetical predicted protein [Olea europaea subsp. europaea]|uniref:Uncharacterized protein n=1 Tax=Olea europaea subsp. europaea TaxID=158383 RepID=A0A8S0UR25_OLEEU|nr:Hypothetical predicted protein [Olea europaea subsp. europaea]
MDEEASHSLMGGCESVKNLTIEDPGTDKSLPLGKPLSMKLPPELIGDVLELSEEFIGSWSNEANLLEKFRRECPELKILLPYSAKSVHKVLSEAHISMLKVSTSERPKTDADALGPKCDNNFKQKLDATIPVLRYLYGDGGLLCGSSIGVAGIEADAKVLAMATKKKKVGC